MVKIAFLLSVTYAFIVGCFMCIYLQILYYFVDVYVQADMAGLREL